MLYCKAQKLYVEVKKGKPGLFCKAILQMLRGFRICPVLHNGAVWDATLQASQSSVKLLHQIRGDLVPMLSVMGVSHPGHFQGDLNRLSS